MRNRYGERFMERYAPTLLDLAPRDLISRAMYSEIREGRGIDGRDYLHLDLTELDPDVLESRLPDIADFVRTYLGIDPAKTPIPVQPTAHYAMGGIPTDVDGRVVIDDKNTPMPGFYAAGECACVSVHGANRLGTNSLVDIIVFGRRAGRDMLRYVAEAEFQTLPSDVEDIARAEVARLLAPNGRERAAVLRSELQDQMEVNASVVRDAEGLAAMQSIIGDLKERYTRISLQDRGRVHNSELTEAVELGNLLDVAEGIVAGALARKESRGGHFREDYPTRDDASFLRHTLVQKVDGRLEISYKPVTITRFQPQERKY